MVKSRQCIEIDKKSFTDLKMIHAKLIACHFMQLWGKWYFYDGLVTQTKTLNIQILEHNFAIVFYKYYMSIYLTKLHTLYENQTSKNTFYQCKLAFPTYWEIAQRINTILPKCIVLFHLNYYKNFLPGGCIWRDCDGFTLILSCWMRS